MRSSAARRAVADDGIPNRDADPPARRHASHHGADRVGDEGERRIAPRLAANDHRRHEIEHAAEVRVRVVEARDDHSARDVDAARRWRCELRDVGVGADGKNPRTADGNRLGPRAR